MSNPSRVGFSAQMWNIWECSVSLKPSLISDSWIESDCSRIKSSYFNIIGSVSSVKRNDDSASLDPIVKKSFGISVVFSPISIFVLNLKHNNRSAVVYLEGFYDFSDLLKIVLITGNVSGIGGSKLHFRVLKKPVRETSEIPFTADIGSGTDKDIHIFLLSDFKE